MSKYNRVTQTVFSAIVGTDDRVNLYDRFLSTDESLGISVDESLRECKKHYGKIVKELIPNIEILARLEEIIIQIRCRETIDSHIALSVNTKGYVYARCLFYRHTREVKDIRALVGNRSDNKTSEEYISIGKEKLITSMNKEINETLKLLRKTNL